MTTFDVRKQVEQEITEIVFAEVLHGSGAEQACKLINNKSSEDKFFSITDHTDQMFINSKEHAENLILALKKAIELEWVV